MNYNSLVSIIIPVFNVESYLAEALNSVINQTYKELEIIIIDDGSTDESGKICDEYADKDRRITVIHQDNKGISNARNTGLNMMSGEVVAFLDSDDAYQLDYIEKMMNALVYYNADIVICRFSIQKTTGKMNLSSHNRIIPPIKEGEYDRKSALRALVDEDINQSVWNKIYNVKIWGKIRFPDGHVFEDIDTTYRLLDASRKIYVIEDSLYMYRKKRPKSITGDRSSKKRIDCALAYSHYESFVERNTPNIFSEEELISIHLIRFHQLVSIYVHSFFQSESQNQFAKDHLKREIVEREKHINIRNCRFITQICYIIIVFCPLLFKIMKPFCIKSHDN